MVDASKVLPFVLIALVVVSAFQAFQLNSLKEKLSEGKVAVSMASKGPATAGGSAGSAAASQGGAAATVPVSIANLPSMVGGC